VNFVDPQGDSPLAAVGVWLAARAQAGAITGGLTGAGVEAVKQYATYESGTSSVPKSLAKVAYSGVKGAVIGGSNAVPVVGSGLTTYVIDLAEQRTSGKNWQESKDHALTAASIASMVSGVMFIAPIPDANTAEAGLVVVAEATLTDALTLTAADLAPGIELTEEDARAVIDKREQSEELRREGVLDHQGPRHRDE
jgi:hypothetical protein